MARMSALGKEAGKQGHTALLEALFWAILLVLCFGVLEALFSQTRLIQSALKTATPHMAIDVWTGKQPGSEDLKTVVYLEFRPCDFVFQKVQDHYQASYEFEVDIFNRSRELVDTKIHQGVIRENDYEVTRDCEKFLLCEFSFLGLAPGQYTAVLLATDRMIQKSAVFETPFEVSLPTSTGLSTSQLLLARKASIPNQNGPSGAGSGIIAAPGALYGALQPELYVYFEIYPDHPRDQDSVRYRLSYVSPDNRQVIFYSGKQKLFGRHIPVFKSVSTADLPPGDYRLMAEIQSLDGRFNLVSEKPFTVFQHPTDLRFRSFKAVLRELALVGSREEIKQLKKVPREQRQQAIAAFWKAHDPTPGTEANELMTEFYRRMELARRNFWNGSQEKGWLSDQGKVFVLYGVPDRVIRRRDPVKHIAVEIWQYHSLHVEAVFLDRYGFGEYRLIQPYSLLAR
ncbi:MAG: GWxTD domain-containing protein [Calditrichaeota bacterium]|nr:MAG: GWxTD domain-containing protein [Calditrichota bacterium]